MCFHSQQSKDAQTLQKRFKAEFTKPQLFKPGVYNGFSFPETPVITNVEPHKIQLFHWGLLPNWTTDISFRKNTLNAKMETVDEKPSFRNVVHNRCLVLIDGFYEWQWLDPKGKNKQKYLIAMPDDEPFALGGLWSVWTDKNTGEVMDTYTILTTEANEQMSLIHNSKKRMPLILTAEDEMNWLSNNPIPPQKNLILKTTTV